MFKRFIIWGFVIFILTTAAWAQSGRRVLAAPRPTPADPSTATSTQSDTNNEETQEVGYSESTTTNPRTLSVSPSLRRKSDDKTKKDSKDKQKNQPAPDSSATSTTDTTAAANVTAGGDDEVLKIETNLITIPVSVYDRNGLYIPNLGKDNFKIFEDGKEQEVAYFGTSDKPFTVILLIDVSPSTSFKIEQIQAAAKSFVDQLKPADSVMVIEFDYNVRDLTQGPTNDRQKIYKAIEKTGFGDGTSLYDAVATSLRKRLNKIDGKKAIVLFTDGVDTSSSRAGFDSTLKDAEESEAMIFPIYYNTFLDNSGGGMGGSGGAMKNPSISMPLPTGGGILGGGGMGNAGGMSAEDYALGRRYLEQLAYVTGGRVFRPESNPGGLTTAFEGIAEELRRQYSIGYYPEAVGSAGDRKQIKVRVNRPHLIVRAKDSYIVGSAEKQAQNTN